MKRKLSDKEKLELLGVTEEDFEAYKLLFVGDRWRYIKRDHEKKAWRTVSFPLTDSTVLYHLHGRYWVGGFAEPVTEVIVIDIDSGKDQLERYEKVLEAMEPAEPLIFESSKSGGLHLYYRLEGPKPTEEARRIAGLLFEAEGIRIEPGKIEVFPSTKKALRLPLGQDSYFLNSDLEISADKPEALKQIRFIVEYDQLPKFTLPELHRSREAVRQAKERGIIRPHTGASEFLRRIQGYLKVGIPGPGSRNNIMSELLWFWWHYEGYRGDDLTQVGCRWLDKNHNGNSQDYNRDREFCYKEIRDWVNSIDRYEQQAEAKKPSRFLSSGDLQRIRQFAGDYKSQRFLFELLTFAKRWGFCEPQRELGFVDPKTEGKLRIHLAASVMQQWPYCSRMRYLKYRRWAEDIGVLEYVAPHAADLKRARAYYLNWDFEPGRVVKQFHRW